MELLDLPGRRVEPGAADDDPNRQTPGNRLEVTSKFRYRKTVTKEDVEEARESVARKVAQKREKEQREFRERHSTRAPLGGGQEEPGG